MSIAPIGRTLDFMHAGERHVVEVDALAALDLPGDVVLDRIKADLLNAVDGEAERLRTKVITPGAGQALEYQEAQTQAAAALKAPASATAEKYPFLAVTVGIDTDPETGAPATDILGVARSIQAGREAWLTIGTAIREARLKGKAAIAAAVTIEEAADAFDAIAWPTLKG